MRRGLPLPAPLLGLAVLAGGGPAAPASAAAGGGSAQTGDTGPPRGGGTLVTGWTAEPAGVNELILPTTSVTQEVGTQFFLRLVEEQADFATHPPTFKPELARGYEWSPDHKMLTFHLREGAVWSDGVPETADDVRFTWQAQTDPAVAWDFA